MFGCCSNCTDGTNLYPPGPPTGGSGGRAALDVRAGGYAAPFANPCTVPLTSPYRRYNDADKSKRAITPSLLINAILDDLGATNLIDGRPLSSCAPVGASSINDHNYKCGAWPEFYSAADGSGVHRWDCQYRAKAGQTVDLGGFCREFGRQQAQFRRTFHGRV